MVDKSIARNHEKSFLYRGNNKTLESNVSRDIPKIIKILISIIFLRYILIQNGVMKTIGKFKINQSAAFTLSFSKVGFMST